MFFDITLLCPQYRGKFAIAWIAATRGIKKLSRKQILDVDIERLCEDITTMFVTQSQKPKARLSLTLTAKLVNGTIKILFHKTIFLQETLSQYMSLAHSLSIKPKVIVAVRGKRKKQVHSDEIVLPAKKRELEVVVPELEITDRDLERILQDVPLAAVDSITLREEMPKRTDALHEEESRFGDEGFIETQRYLLEHGPPITEGEKRELEAIILRDQSQKSRQDLDLDVIQVEKEPIIKEIDLENIIENIDEQEKQKTGRLHSQDSLDAIQVIPSEEPPKKKARKEDDFQKQIIPSEERPSKKARLKDDLAKEKQQKQVAETEENVQELQRPAEKKAPPKTPKLSIQKRVVNLAKVSVKSKSSRTRRIMRCSEEDLEIFEIRICEPLSIELDRFDNIFEECQEMLSILMVETPIEVARELQSYGSRATGSISGLHRLSHETPTAAVPSRRDTADLIPEQEIFHQPVIVETPILTGEEIPRLRRILTPTELDVVQLPIGESTTIGTLLEERKLEDGGLHTITEDIPPAAAAATRKEKIVTAIIKETRKEPQAKSGNTRQQEIIRLIKQWDFNTHPLTIEDICIKPINRLNVAVAFYDLLNLQKLQYVSLKRKEHSLELDTIEKGTKLLKNH